MTGRLSRATLFFQRRVATRETAGIWIAMSRAGLDMRKTGGQGGAMSEVKAIALSELGETLSSLRLCSEASSQAMERSLRQTGQLTPVLCYPGDSSLQIFDGFKRLRAARVLGWLSLRVQCVATDGVEAKLSLWEVHEGSGLSELEQAWLVRSLYRDEHLPQHTIAQRMGRHKSWVCRRLMLAEGLSEVVEAHVRLGLVSATAARELCRLPRGNQEQAANAVVQRGLTTRQTLALVDALLVAGDEAARRRLLDEAAATRRHIHKTPGEKLVADCQTIRNLSARLRVQLLGRPLLSLGAPAAELAVQSLEALHPTLVDLAQSIQTVIGEKEAASEPIAF